MMTFLRNGLLPCPVMLQGHPVTDSLYTKVIKDLCTSKGQHWSLKPGADM